MGDEQHRSGEVIRVDELPPAEIARQTPTLRIKAGVLQQLFEISVSRSGRVLRQGFEWRDVPSED